MCFVLFQKKCVQEARVCFICEKDKDQKEKKLKV